MNQIPTVGGIDWAKNVFQVHGMNSRGKTVLWHKFHGWPLEIPAKR